MEINEVLDEQFTQDGHVTIPTVTTTQFTVLFLCSLGLYGPWWMYKQWKFFKEKDNLDIMPAARAIFSIFFMHGLLERIKRFAGSNGVTAAYSSTGLFVWYIVCNVLSNLPDPAWLFSFLGVFSFFPPVKVFTEALTQSAVYTTTRTGFNTRQIILIVLGLLFWGLILLGLMLPEDSYSGESF
ncbi:MAG: hypothetical protein AAF960_02560 [Bacteroidota bacterium]